MDPIKWRKLEEATADATKCLWKHYKECRNRGFSRRQAFDLTKLMFTSILADILLKSRREG